VRGAGRTELRLWSAGCAGGEEAYSLALLIAGMAPVGIPASILATDVSEPVLTQARAGLYPPGHLSELPELLRAACFHLEGNQYRLERHIREMVEFCCHDLVAADHYPPADLILCRNVLIYLSHEEQARILARFAAALNEGGVLVLGRTESLPSTDRPLFRAEFPRERIFRRLPGQQP
jgi:chemotaxis protein methyltransferase CheR